MNRVHGLICSSGWWARTVENKLLPWGLAGVDLDGDVLEIGPGFGATTRVLARRARSLTVLELDAGYAARLRRKLGDGVDVVQGDATAMPARAAGQHRRQLVPLPRGQAVVRRPHAADDRRRMRRRYDRPFREPGWCP